MTMKNILSTVAIALVTSILTFAGAKRFIYNDIPLQSADPINIKQTSDTDGSAGAVGGYVNLEDAAERSVKSVVHINVKTNAQVVESRGDDFFSQFFGNQRQYIPPQAGSGSGVIISADGFIVTNNHVVNNASEVTVTLNDKRTVTAKVIGTDPNTDLALIKIEESNLPFLNYANSDNVRLGEWVLAVGYPLQLESTVTAGIISAKSRRLGINDQKNTTGTTSVESFIQTDAAVNPGNSGGALVNAKGDLIGINSAIASPTGSYAGYSYAIPANLVKKVVADLKKYGNVQRGYLGIVPLEAKDASDEQLSAYSIDKVDGVFVLQVSPDGGAQKAGLKMGDFITAINDVPVKTFPEMQGQLGNYKPGDKVKINYLRNSKPNTTIVELKNLNNNTEIVKNNYWNNLGASYRALSKAECAQVGIPAGVLVTNISNGLIAQQSEMAPKYIITSANNKPVRNEAELKAIVSALNAGDKLELLGVYPGYRGQYDYTITMK
jgi:serine protease Do